MPDYIRKQQTKHTPASNAGLLRFSREMAVDGYSYGLFEVTAEDEIGEGKVSMVKEIVEGID